MSATDVLYCRLPAETMAAIRELAGDAGLPISTFVDIVLCEALGIPETRAARRRELFARIVDGGLGPKRP